MNFSPSLQRVIEEIALSQGISPEQFIVQTLLEKISRFKPDFNVAAEAGLRDQDGLLVFDTESLDHIDFNALIAQSREEQAWEPQSCESSV